MSSDTEEFKHNSIMHLPGKDFLWILDNYLRDPEDAENLAAAASLLQESPDLVRKILESEELINAVMNKKDAILEISPYLFFNIIYRKTIRYDESAPEGFVASVVEKMNQSSLRIDYDSARQALADNDTIDYITNMLAIFIQEERIRHIQATDKHMVDYITDMQKELLGADPERKFKILEHIGNFSLFLLGLFRDYVRNRARTRPINEDFYISQGRSGYLAASRFDCAKRSNLDHVLVSLSDQFELFKEALNTMRERFFPNEDKYLLTKAS